MNLEQKLIFIFVAILHVLSLVVSFDLEGYITFNETFCNVNIDKLLLVIVIDD